MAQVSPPDDQARFRAELKRSHALRDGMIAGALAQGVAATFAGLAAWLHRPGEAKHPPSRPRSSAG